MDSPARPHAVNQSPADRIALGRAARREVPRSALGEWSDDSRTAGVLDIVLGQNADRLPDLAPIRTARMATSPWHFYRGAAALMAADQATGAHTDLTVQLCGDAHVLNFGLWATPERNLAFDLRDFDETLPGPFEWDVERLATSLVVVSEANGRPHLAKPAVAAALASYREHLSEHARGHELDVWYDATHVDRFLGVFTEPEVRERVSARIRKQAGRRTSRGALEKLSEIVDGKPQITENAPFRVHLGDVERARVTAAFDGYRESLDEHNQHLLDRFTLVDVVRQVVGVGSVGMRVYLALLEGRGGDDPLLLQLKQAGPSVYEPFVGASRHANHGQRVVVGKRLIQSATDIFVGWTQVGDQHFYVRQFRDMKIIPDSARISPILVEFAAACGSVLAAAHARTGDALAIDSYVGRGRAFDKAITAFAFGYAEQNTRDHAELAAAVARGEVAAGPSW